MNIPDPEDIEDLAHKLFGQPNRRLSRRGELRFGRRGSVVVIPGRGVFADHEAGVAGGVLQMIVHGGAARSLADAARLLETGGLIEARERAAEGQAPVRREQAALMRRRASAATLWAQARPLAGTVAETYLRHARAIAVPLDGADLRFLLAAPFYPYAPHRCERHPAMVARVADASGRGIGAHLTYLRRDGSGKADLEPPRKAVGTIGGGFIRLAPGSALIVGEGIESSLSAWQARPSEAAAFGAVSAVSAGGLGGLTWPAGTKALVVAPDRDRAGEDAARGLARRAYAAGLAVSFLRPPADFKDWNDAAQAQGARL